MESVLRDGSIAMVPVAVHNTIITAMEHAPERRGSPAMDCVMRDMLTAMDIATRKHTIIITIETAMEHASPRKGFAMENVWKDMLNVLAVALLKKCMTNTCGIVVEDVLVRVDNAMEPAQMEELRVETIGASVVMMIPTAGTPAQSTGSATAPVYPFRNLVIRSAPLDSTVDCIIGK